MILGAEMSVESGRLVFLLRCADCRQVFVRDGIDEIRADVEALPEFRRPWRCEPCAALHRSTMAGAFEEVGDAAAKLWTELLAPFAALLDKVRAWRRR